MSIRAKKRSKVAVYDFDKTIISIDSGFQFFKWQILKSKLKTLVAVLLFVVFGVFIFVPKIRFGLFKCLAWIATWGLDKSMLRSEIRWFSNNYQSICGGWIYKDALRQIKLDREAGFEILIISGAPKILVKEILRSQKIPVTKVIASECKYFWGGIIAEEHCYGSHKLVMAERQNEVFASWHFGYSDSKADFPFLEKCSSQCFVNSSAKLKKQAMRHFGKNVQFVL